MASRSGSAENLSPNARTEMDCTAGRAGILTTSFLSDSSQDSRSSSGRTPPGFKDLNCLSESQQLCRGRTASRPPPLRAEANVETIASPTGVCEVSAPTMARCVVGKRATNGCQPLTKAAFGSSSGGTSRGQLQRGGPKVHVQDDSMAEVFFIGTPPSSGIGRHLLFSSSSSGPPALGQLGAPVHHQNVQLGGQGEEPCKHRLESTSIFKCKGETGLREWPDSPNNLIMSPRDALRPRELLPSTRGMQTSFSAAALRSGAHAPPPEVRQPCRCAVSTARGRPPPSISNGHNAQHPHRHSAPSLRARSEERQKSSPGSSAGRPPPTCFPGCTVVSNASPAPASTTSAAGPLGDVSGIRARTPSTASRRRDNSKLRSSENPRASENGRAGSPQHRARVSSSSPVRGNSQPRRASTSPSRGAGASPQERRSAAAAAAAAARPMRSSSSCAVVSPSRGGSAAHSSLSNGGADTHRGSAEIGQRSTTTGRLGPSFRTGCSNTRHADEAHRTSQGRPGSTGRIGATPPWAPPGSGGPASGTRTPSVPTSHSSCPGPTPRRERPTKVAQHSSVRSSLSMRCPSLTKRLGLT